jgi:hypothetical protein
VLADDHDQAGRDPMGGELIHHARERELARHGENPTANRPVVQMIYDKPSQSK